MRLLGIILAIVPIVASVPAIEQNQTTCPIQAVDTTAILTATQISALRKISAKGEYETTRSFEDRILRIVPGNIEVSIEIPKSLIKYDADRGELKLEKTILPLADEMLKSSSTANFEYYEMVTLQNSKRITGTYIGQNAFGARAKVDIVKASSFGLSWKSTGSPGFNPAADIVLPLQPMEVQSVHGKLRILLIGEISAPYILSDSDYSGATIDAPTDYSSEKKALIVAPQCAAIYDPTTERIYASWLPSAGY